MKNKIFVFLFLGVIYSLFLINILKPQQELSYSERRKLAAFPKWNSQAISGGSFMSDLDKYTVDQFPYREPFRRLKAVVNNQILLKSDNNGIFVIGDHVFKMEYPLNARSVTDLCDKMNEIYDTHLTGMNVYFSIIPDKNYYMEKQNHLTLDYTEMESIMLENIRNMTYLSLFDILSADDYYRTDSHLKQENLDGVVQALGSGMNIPIPFDIANYKKETFYPFYGVYYGQSALNIKPDELNLLVNETTENARVEILQSNGIYKTSLVYDAERLGKMDSYDVFLSGAAPVVILKNEANTSGRDLIIFRDSYASSLAPLLLNGYRTITLIDLRYIHSGLIGQYVDFENQDVLFLYSTTIINNSHIIR